MNRIAAFLAIPLLTACAEVRPDTVVSPRLDSGITSSNGGGARALDNGTSESIAPRVGPARGRKRR